MQGGDTPELVSAAYFNLVAHPPGYPLWNLVQSFWIHTIPVKTIFWRASFLNSIFAIFALLLASYSLRNRFYLMFVFVISLAFSSPFFQAAVLPDVFSLHALIISGICFLYLSKDTPVKVRMFGIPFLFFIGMSNHLTIIFIFPVIVDSYLENWKLKKSRRYLSWGAVVGIVLTIILYFTILEKNTSSYYSWSNINNLKKLYEHFLRADYGTFQLSVDQQVFKFNFESVYYFFKSSFLYLIYVFVFIAFKLRFKINLLKSRKALCLMLSIFCSLIFLGMANFSIQGMGKEIISRFHLMPILLIMFLIMYLLEKMIEQEVKISLIEKSLLLLLVLHNSSTELINNRFLSNDSVFEDYANHLLQEAGINGAKVIFTSNDNIYFGLRYIKLQRSEYNDIAVISTSLLFHGWYVEKLEKLLPDFKIENKNKIFKERKLNLFTDVLNPNIQKFSFVFPNGFQDTKNFKITFLQLGRIVSKGSGIYFQSNGVLPKLEQGKYEVNFYSFQGFSKKYIWADYSNYDLARGLVFYSQNNTIDAAKAWRKAISIVPYCYPAYINLCMINNLKDAVCTKENLERVKQESELIF